MENLFFMDEAIKLAEKAKSKGEIPVGVVVVENRKVIVRSFNKRHNSNRCIDHAEIIALNKAARKKKDWRLSECDMYVTLEPCDMCKEAIKQSRIRNVYIGTKNKKAVNYKTKFHFSSDKIMANKCSDLLSMFFVDKR